MRLVKKGSQKIFGNVSAASASIVSLSPPTENQPPAPSACSPLQLFQKGAIAALPRISPDRAPRCTRMRLPGQVKKPEKARVHEAVAPDKWLHVFFEQEDMRRAFFKQERGDRSRNIHPSATTRGLANIAASLPSLDGLGKDRGAMTEAAVGQPFHQTSSITGDRGQKGKHRQCSE
jgi:hypothetical protein